jgi:hypothetical protein
MRGNSHVRFLGEGAVATLSYPTAEGCGMVRGVVTVASRLILGLIVGLILGAGYWAAALAWEGHGVAEALRCEVEDGLGLLQGLLALGGLCGTGVGLCSGLTALDRTRSEPGVAGGRARD